ncbi:ANTAR domain-containing protein [Actinoplanes sp. NPDC023801]|uniref:ANTAR domain-containing response regulator n=1 Tax=Actinoplanes sp. NPDC023801 TaxID=3154595 RepID=UPI0033E0D483
MHAFPLRLRTQVIGALNIFGNSTGGAFEPTDVPVMQALADVATIGLMQERAIRRSEALAEQLQGALNTRIIIEQAKGALAQVRDISVDEAFRVIRAYARNNNQRLTVVAELIVTDPTALPGPTRS